MEENHAGQNEGEPIPNRQREHVASIIRGQNKASRARCEWSVSFAHLHNQFRGNMLLARGCFAFLSHGEKLSLF